MSSFEEVRSLSDFARNACSEIFSPDEITRIELAIVESANNIIKHAYLGDSKHSIEFIIVREESTVKFVLANNGVPFDGNHLSLSGKLDLPNLQEVPEHGRGLFLIRSAMDTLDFYREGMLNYQVMRKKTSQDVSVPSPLPSNGRPELMNRLMTLENSLENARNEVTQLSDVATISDDRLRKIFGFAEELSVFADSNAIHKDIIGRMLQITGSDWGQLRLQEGFQLISHAMAGPCPPPFNANAVNVSDNDSPESSASNALFWHISGDFRGCGYSIICLPFVGLHGLRGTLLLGKNETDYFNMSLAKFIRALTAVAAAIIENRSLHTRTVEAELARSEMSIAVTLHKNLISKMVPQMPGLSLFAGSEPALEIGGDYLTFHKASESVLWFMVCDAMGKGMAASFFSILAHMTFQSVLFLHKDLSPGELLTISNKIMNKEFDRFGMFMTALAGKIDISSGLLTYASAGHCPPIFFKPKEGVELLDTQDYMLGVDGVTSYHTYSMPFLKGMRFLAYTDGMTDIIDPSGDAIGVEPLMEACEYEFSKRDMQTSCERILSFALKVADPERRDDISLIGIERT